MSWVREHVKSRWVDDSRFKVWYDDSEDLATFPLWNLSGQLVGYQQYRPKADKRLSNLRYGSRYFTYCVGAKVRLWGMESWLQSQTLFLTEGVFKSARLSSLGYSSLALLSNDPDESTKRFLSIVMRMRKVVAVGDPGQPGKKLLKFGHVSYQMPRADVDEATEDELNEMFSSVGEN